MEKEIVAAIATVLGAMIGAFGIYFTSIIGRKIDAAKRDAVSSAMEVVSYHRLERIYAELVASKTDESFRVVQNRMRSKVEELGFLRPTMTTRRANQIVGRWK